jgi:hypothetical protein
MSHAELYCAFVIANEGPVPGSTLIGTAGVEDDEGDHPRGDDRSNPRDGCHIGR